MTENFEFKEQERIEPQRVGIVITALESLGVEENRRITLDDVSARSVAEMDEPAVARYLNSFLRQIQSGQMNIEDLKTHSVFQTVLAKAKDLAGA
jgi:hypothetical protein